MFAEDLKRLRSDAIRVADALLRDKGFNKFANHWEGALDASDLNKIQIRLCLPEEFPDRSPEIFIDRQQLTRRVPHVEKNGKLCLVPSTGTLIDAGNIHGIVSEILARARDLLTKGLSGSLDDDFYQEFLSYWNPSATETFLSICSATGSFRELCVAQVEGHWVRHGYKYLVADNIQIAKRWLGLLRGTVKEVRRGVFVPLTSPFMPPDFEEMPSVNDMLKTISSNANLETYNAFRDWLNRSSLPVIAVLSIPLKIDQGHALIAVRFEEARGKAKREALRGFRPSTLRASREVEFTKQQQITKVRLDRFDEQYILPRGGANVDLVKSTVVVVGCGSVGSHVVERLASLGVGNLRLIDHESLMSENVHRHALGSNFVGDYKVEGLCQQLGERYPHIKFEHRHKKIEEILKNEPEFLIESNLLIIATGDETLELRLNNLLRCRVPRIHAWLDPMGIGGHVLATAVVSGPGCYQCLFQNDDEFGLVNAASFARPGQRFEKSYAGCGGSFLPFGGVHADRTAIEVALIAARILLCKESENVLVSWFGDTRAFLEERFLLSDRQALFEPGETRRETKFPRSDCPVCRQSYS